MSVDARFEGAHLDVVDAHRVLTVGVAGQPRDDGRTAGHVRRPHGGRPQRHVLAHHHGASSVPRRPTVRRHRPHADAVRLNDNI